MTICYSCKGQGFQQSWDGTVVACVFCNGSGDLKDEGIPATEIVQVDVNPVQPRASKRPN